MAIYEDTPTNVQDMDTVADPSVQPAPEVMVTPDQAAAAETGTDYQALILKLDDLQQVMVDSSSADQQSMYLITAVLCLAVGLMIGYIAVRGFFDNWTQHS